MLVNNAGVGWLAPLADFPEKGWDKVMDLNVKTPFFLTQAMIPLLSNNATADSTASVINIGSIAGIMGRTDTFSYAPSKAAIHQLTRVLADELAPRHIHVNAIAPGFFPSELTAPYLADEQQKNAMIEDIPAKRIGTPEDIGALAIAIATNRYMLGIIIPIDGGASLG